MTHSKYRRVVLKLSGEAFADRTIGYGIDAVVVARIAEEVSTAREELSVEIAVVVGMNMRDTPAIPFDPDLARETGELACAL